jgi:hypothetical protein
MHCSTLPWYLTRAAGTSAIVAESRHRFDARCPSQSAESGATVTDITKSPSILSNSFWRICLRCSERSNARHILASSGCIFVLIALFEHFLVRPRQYKSRSQRSELKHQSCVRLSLSHRVQCVMAFTQRSYDPKFAMCFLAFLDSKATVDSAARTC